MEQDLQLATRLCVSHYSTEPSATYTYLKCKHICLSAQEHIYNFIFSTAFSKR